MEELLGFRSASKAFLGGRIWIFPYCGLERNFCHKHAGCLGVWSESTAFPSRSGYSFTLDLKGTFVRSTTTKSSLCSEYSMYNLTRLFPMLSAVLGSRVPKQLVQEYNLFHILVFDKLLSLYRHMG